METPQEDKVEVLSVIGDQEKSWSIDRYHLTVAVSIVSVFVVVGGIMWLASGGGGNASGANPFPTGELEFGQKDVKGSGDYRTLPYPSVRQAVPLVTGKQTPSKTPTKGPTPTESPTATTAPTPTPTTAQSTPDPTATPTVTPAPTAVPSPSIVPSDSPTPTQ